jgi:hypothetical protein
MDHGEMSLDDEDESEEEPDEFFGMGSDEVSRTTRHAHDTHDTTHRHDTRDLFMSLWQDEEEEEEETDLNSAQADQQKMRRLMREMDLELQKTKLADDFEKAPRPEEVLGTDTARYLVPPLLLLLHDLALIFLVGRVAQPE